MLIPGPTEPVSESAPPRHHGRFWRGALLLGGGAAGVVVGIALSAAFSSGAEASPLPTQTVQGAPTVGALTGGATSIVNPDASTVGGSPGVSSDPTRTVATPALETVHGTTESLPTTAGRLPGPLVRTVATSLLSAGLDGFPGTLGISTSTHTQATATSTTGAADPWGAELSVLHPGVRGASNPSSPRRSPLQPLPVQLPPPTGNESVGSSLLGQGGSPLGSLPPTSVLLLPLLLGALVLAREKTPLLVFDSRYSPPG